MDEVDRSSHAGAGEHELASEVSERIRTIIASAEAAANAVRHEAEQHAQVKRRVAEEEARRIVDEARRDAEAYLAERIRRISELSDAVVERGEGIVMRLERAEEVRRQLQGLADALGESAEKLADELGSEPGVERRARPEAVAAEPEAAPREPEPEAAPREPEAAPREPEASEPEPEAAAPEAAAASPETAEPEAAAPDAETEAAEIADDPVVGELADEAADADAPAIPREADEQLSARLVALQMAVAGGKRDEIESHLRRTFELGDVDSILDDVFGNGDEAEQSVAPSRQADGAA